MWHNAENPRLNQSALSARLYGLFTSSPSPDSPLSTSQGNADMTFQEAKEAAKEVCVGCKNGTPFFLFEGTRGAGVKTLWHLDFFATPWTGAIFSCKAYDLLAPFIASVDDKGNVVWRD